MAGTLEQLWMSYNMVEKLKGITVLKNLKVKGKLSSSLYVCRVSEELVGVELAQYSSWY